MHEPTFRTTLSRAGVALAALLFVAALVPSVTSAKEVEIKMTDTPAAFVPNKVTIKVGDKVEWINNAQSLHSVDANPANAQTPGDVVLPAGVKPFDSGFMAPGAKYSYTFTVPGTYKYVCLPHEKDGMKGEIVVEK
jgi:plastocyanin